MKRRYPSEGWSCVGYIHSDRRALVSCIKGKAEVSTTGQAALDRQDDRVHQWRRAGSTGKVELAARPTMHLGRRF